ncbi:MAG: c-type cytochrome [Planctomycetota bacterium]|jgi:mono/diheme cytochrome c family protein
MNRTPRTGLLALCAVCIAWNVSCSKKDEPAETKPANDAGNQVAESRTAEPGNDSPAADAVRNLAEKAVATTGEVDEAAAGLRAWNQGMCAKCHKEDGKGGNRAPNLTDKEWLHCDGSIEGIRKVLISGVPRENLKDPERPFGMNSVKNLIADEEKITALATYVHQLSQIESD